MNANETLEMNKRRHELDRDTERLVDKYLKIFEWEIPESNEHRLHRMIIDELRLALDRLEKRV